MKNILILVIIGIILSACKGTEPIYIPTHDSTSVISTETVEDSPTWTDPESILLRFAFECDSNYNVLLRNYNELNSGLRNKVQIQEVIKYREDKTAVQRLEVDISVLVDSLEIQNRTIERLRNEKTYIEVPYPVETPVKFIPKLYKWSFGVLLGLVVICITYLILRFKLGKTLHSLF